MKITITKTNGENTEIKDEVGIEWTKNDNEDTLNFLGVGQSIPNFTQDYQYLKVVKE
jgi:hypothetical protein